MARNKSKVGELTVNLLDRFPNTPTLTLAKRLFKDNPEVFDSVEHARQRIRYYRGQLGDYNRKVIKTKKYLAPKGDWNPFGLPDSDADDHDPFIIPSQYNKGLILADIHAPYHDVEALTQALTYGRDNGANCVILNGDILDFYSLSRFEKDPRVRRFDQEIEIGKQILAAIYEVIPKIFYKIGNHEERFERYMKVKAPELLGLAEFEIENLLSFHDYNCEVIRDKRIIKLGKLPIVHGHEFHSKSTSQVNPARGLFLKSSKSALVSHSHRTSTHAETDIEGKLITCHSTGCLCGLSPEYARINKWNHGFAFVEVEKDGAYSVHNKRIYKGRTW